MGVLCLWLTDGCLKNWTATRKDYAMPSQRCDLGYRRLNRGWMAMMSFELRHQG